MIIPITLVKVRATTKKSDVTTIAKTRLNEFKAACCTTESLCKIDVDARLYDVNDTAFNIDSTKYFKSLSEE